MAPAHLLARAVEGVQERTVCGALVTFCAVASIALLLFFELSAFFAPVTIHHLGVDDGDSAWGSRSFKVPDRLPIDVHMTFAHVECDDLEISVESARGLKEAINRVEFRPPTPSELGAWAPAADPEAACTLDGRLSVGKVSANFHVGLSPDADGPGGGRPVGLPGPLAMLVGQINMMEKHRHVNITHKVHALSFGKKTGDTAAPLDGVVNSPTESGQQHYVLKVIPTVIHGAFGYTMTNQYEPGQKQGDSSSLQHECSARDRSRERIHASRALREMIARPKVSRNEWKMTERGASKVGNVALFSCQVQSRGELHPRAAAPRGPVRDAGRLLLLRLLPRDHRGREGAQVPARVRRVHLRHRRRLLLPRRARRRRLLQEPQGAGR
jgi:hypothetical protein